MSHTPKDCLLLIGSYAKQTDPGIYTVRYAADPPKSDRDHAPEAPTFEAPTFTVIDHVRGIVNPSYLALHPAKNRLYVASESLDHSGSLAVYERNPLTGDLVSRQSQPVKDASPCYVTTDRSARCLLSANYLGGSITVCTLADNGMVTRKTQEIYHTGHGIRMDRQEAAHPHAVAIDAANRFALVPDLGIDEIVTYELSISQSSLTKVGSHRAVAGSGPRLFLFHPERAAGYAIFELNNTIEVFDYDPERGSLQVRQSISTLPSDFSGTNTAAHVALSADARFLYASNRGHDSIVVYEVHPDNGTLHPIQWIHTEGSTPRHFAIMPDGLTLIVANQDSNTLVALAIDPHTGLLRSTGAHLAIAQPSCVAVVE